MEQLFGVTRQESVGRQLSSLLPEELAREIDARGDQEQITGIYKQRLHHQGKSLTLNVSITPLVSKSNERIGRLLLFDDVTQRERLEEQMSQTEKLTSLGLLAAGVAHEVNTPLAVISNYIQMLAVRTAAHNGSVEVEVADTGAGIAREHIHRIFDPFFTTKASGRGTGLGLSVSYGIIKEHSGKIDVRSTPGKGTSFHVEFPAVRKAVHV